MKWLRLLVLVLLAAAALVVLVLLGPLRARTTEVARQRLERELTAALHTPVAVGALRIALVPPAVEADAVVLGADGVLAHAAHVTVRLLPRTSLRQRRPVVDATLDDVFVDVPGWVALLKTPTPPAPTPPFRLRAVHITGARVRLSTGAEPLDFDADTIDGALAATALGRLHFDAAALQVSLTRRGAVLRLERARARGGETDTGWRLTAAEAIGDGVQLASGAAASDRLPIRGRLALPRLAFASELFERLSGDVEMDAALIGPLDEPAAAGSLRVANLHADGERVGEVSATAAWNLQRLTVSAAHLTGFGGTAEASGDLTLTAPFAYGADLRWSSLDVQQLTGLGPPIKPAAATGRAELSGTLEPAVVAGEGSGSIIAAAGGDPLAWHGRGTYRDGAGTLELDGAQARVNTLRARLDIGPGGALSGSLDTAVADPAALGTLLPVESVPNFSGSLTASAQLAGTITDPRLSGQLTGRRVALLGVGIETLAGSFVLDRSALRTPGITATLWQGSIGVDGTIALSAAAQNEWRARGDDLPGDAVVALINGLTGRLLPVGRGTLAFSVSGRGPWSGVQVGGGATMRQFWLGREWVQQAMLQGSATWPRWQLDAALHNRSGQAVTAHGSGSAGDDVAMVAQSAGWDLTSVQRGELSEMGGRLTLDAALSGAVGELSGHAALQGSDLVLGGRRLGAAAIDAVATRGRWQLTAALFDGAFTLRGGLAPDPGWPFSVDSEWTDAEVGRLLVPGSDVSVSSSGTLQIGGRLTAVEQFRATLRLDALRLANGPYELTAAQPAVLECRGGICTLERLELRGPDTALRANATVATSGAVRLGLSGEGDLRLLELADGAIESARGRFGVDAEVRRGSGRWEVSGQMTFDDAALDVGAPVAITRASGRLSLLGTIVRVDRLAGRMGTGAFAVGGAVDLTRGPDLTWTVTDIGADLIPALEVELSGRGSLTGTWEHMRLAGRLDVARMLYDRDIELTDLLPSLNRALSEAPRPPAGRRVDLDLHVVAPGELYVENNIARIEARADVQVSGTAEHPLLDGRIEALDGQVMFRDRTFELQGATVDFRPDLGLTAALNIGAESVVDTADATYTVGVRVTGTTDNPRVTLSSDDPSLTQTDLATLIAVGKTTTQLREGGSSGFSFGLQQDTKQLLPIDRVSFDTTYSRTTGTFEPQIKLGKDLTDNLALAVGQTFGVESRTIAEADYRLTPRLFIPLSWESQTSTQEGAFAAGVKWRYEFWRVTPYTLLGGLH